MNKGKYIVIEVDGLEHAVIFDAVLVHADVARRIGKPVVSAGFIRAQTWRSGFEIEVYGESESLKLKSRPTDLALVQRTLGL